MAGFSTSATPCASSITVFLTSGGLSQSQNALVAPAASVPLKIAARKSRHVRPRLACVAGLGLLPELLSGLLDARCRSLQGFGGLLLVQAPRCGLLPAGLLLLG